MRREIRATGTIEADETRATRIAARVAGRLERLHLDFTGQQVGRGAPIYSIFSPELLAAQRELLLALDNLGAGSGQRVLELCGLRRIPGPGVARSVAPVGNR